MKIRVNIEFDTQDASQFIDWIEKMNSRGGIHVADSDYFFRTKTPGIVRSVKAVPREEEDEV